MLDSKGFSLVEMMISMVAGTLVLGAVIGLYTSIMNASHISVRMTRLNQELMAVVNLIARDLQRAGYFAGSANNFKRTDTNSDGVIDNSDVSAAINTDFVFKPAIDLQALDSVAPNYDCVLVRYDVDGDGTLSPGDYHGYRYSSISKGIQSWNSASVSLCNGGSWQSITDNNEVLVTGFTMELVPPTAVSSSVRSLQITIEGQHKLDNTLRVRVERLVKIRNGYYQRE
ncbi:prepilin-type N-terminal cleavage/methylation domain-containing protein [Dongshaea marina]|uniref:prepilin-type N-terminal cleavage/methylation domain-containing protein n=1 Tax=Dongshaea marina TaxID=2047966 RepID=UPI000D3E98C6|nr:prepilin-type N-terminal cleavage/methylation domain-containing protein [Dongshaea marina]